MVRLQRKRHGAEMQHRSEWRGAEVQLQREWHGAGLQRLQRKPGGHKLRLRDSWEKGVAADRSCMSNVCRWSEGSKFEEAGRGRGMEMRRPFDAKGRDRGSWIELAHVTADGGLEECEGNERRRR